MFRVTRLSLYLALYLVLFTEQTFFYRVSVHNVLPDMLLIVTVFFGIFYGVRTGLEVGLVSGLIKDVFLTGPFGLNICVFGGIGLFCGLLSDKIYKENILTQFLIVFAVALSVSRLHVPFALYTAFFAVIMFLGLRYLFISKESF